MEDGLARGPVVLADWWHGPNSGAVRRRERRRKLREGDDASCRLEVQLLELPRLRAGLESILGQARDSGRVDFGVWIRAARDSTKVQPALCSESVEVSSRDDALG